MRHKFIDDKLFYGCAQIITAVTTSSSCREAGYIVLMESMMIELPRYTPHNCI